MVVRTATARTPRSASTPTRGANSAGRRRRRAPWCPTTRRCRARDRGTRCPTRNRPVPLVDDGGDADCECSLIAHGRKSYPARGGRFVPTFYENPNVSYVSPRRDQEDWRERFRRHLGAGALGAEFVAAEASPEFANLWKTLRRFVFPMTAFFLIWYAIYALLGAFAHDFMGKPVWGNINVGRSSGLCSSSPRSRSPRLHPLRQ